jgi:putative transposase
MYEITGKSIPWGESQAVIAKLKKLEEYSWLKEVNSQSLQFAHRCLKEAFERFFSNKANYPRYKKRNGKKSFTIPQNVFLEKGNSRHGLLILPKFRKGIKVRIHRKVEGKIKFASIVQERSGEFYVNIVVEEIISYDMRKLMGK